MTSTDNTSKRIDEALYKLANDIEWCVEVRGAPPVNRDREAQAVEQAKSLIMEELQSTEQNAVAWCVGVVDQLHFGEPADIDATYKGIKNTIRGRYEEAKGVDPAPNYPVKAKLLEQLEKGKL